MNPSASESKNHQGTLPAQDSADFGPGRTLLGETTAQEEYPFASHFLDLDGLRLHYLDEGSGDPVVMVHGNPTWSFYYRSLIKGLRDRFRVIVPDHMGCGLSEKPGDERYEYSLARRTADLGALLDHLGVTQKVTLIIHDWGGMIGMAWASQHPERIRRLVVFNTAAFHLPTAKPFPFALRVCRSASLGAVLVRGLSAFCRAANRVCCTRHKMSPAVRTAYAAPYNSWANRIAVHRFVQDIPMRRTDRGFDLITEVQERLQCFAETPTLICWGLKDFVFDQHFLDEWTRYLPHAQVHRFEDCGHYILEDASQEIVPLVQQFLDS